MKITSLSLYTFSQSIRLELPNIGDMCLINALSEAEIDTIFSICMSAACRKLNIETLKESIKPEVLHLEHIQDGEFSEAAPR